MIYTSYFAVLKKVLAQDPNLVPVSIAGKTPTWLEGSIIEVNKYKPLMPHYDWWSQWHSKFEGQLESEESKTWYIKHYKTTVLDKLKASQVWQDLMDLSHKHNVVLLCYETPDKFCHRHLVANWLVANGIMCKELCLQEQAL